MVAIGFLPLTSWKDLWRRLSAQHTTFRWRDALFLSFVAYYFAQSIRTLVATETWAIAMYAGYFAYVAVVYLILRAYKIQEQARRAYSGTVAGRLLSFDLADIVIALQYSTMAFVSYRESTLRSSCTSKTQTSLRKPISSTRFGTSSSACTNTSAQPSSPTASAPRPSPSPCCRS